METREQCEDCGAEAIQDGQEHCAECGGEIKDCCVDCGKLPTDCDCED